jgi:hypothetical protein
LFFLRCFGQLSIEVDVPEGFQWEGLLNRQMKGYL